jgi:hypothetical protein
MSAMLAGHCGVHGNARWGVYRHQGAIRSANLDTRHFWLGALQISDEFFAG